MDTGAEANCIDITEAKRLKLKINPTTQSAKNADDVTELEVLGEVSTTFERSGQTFDYDGLVSANLSSLILARVPFIKGNEVVQVLHKHRITFERENKKYSILEIPPFCPKPAPSTYLRKLTSERPIVLGSGMLDGSVCELQLPQDFPPDSPYIIENVNGTNQAIAENGLFPQPSKL